MAGGYALVKKCPLCKVAQAVEDRAGPSPRGPFPRVFIGGSWFVSRQIPAAVVVVCQVIEAYYFLSAGK